MNTFAHIKIIGKYDKVSYYSVMLDGNQTSMFEDFFTNHEVKNFNKLNHIMKWLDVIGKRYGARKDYFRNEAETADASALPPTGLKKEPSYFEKGKKKANNLRLYCLQANEHVVFLFNGDIKTTKYPQDCPNVKEHFKLANQLTEAIDEAFKEKQIKWNNSATDIEFEPDLTIYF